MCSSQVVYVWWSLLWAPSLASWVQVAMEHRLRTVYAASAWDVLHVVPVVATRLFTIYQQSVANVRLRSTSLSRHELSKVVFGDAADKTFRCARGDVDVRCYRVSLREAGV